VSIWGILNLINHWQEERKEKERLKAEGEFWDLALNRTAKPPSGQGEARINSLIKQNKGVATGRIRCPSCGLEVADFDERCWKCGAVLRVGG